MTRRRSEDRRFGLRHVDVLLLISFYTLVAAVVFVGLPAWLCLGLFLLVFAVHVIHNRRSAMWYPCAAAPFMFVVRAPHPSSPLLAVFLDALVVGAIVVVGLDWLVRRSRMDRGRAYCVLLLLCHALVSVVVCLVHVGNVSFLPVIVRTYGVPLTFCAMLILASVGNAELPAVCLRLFVLSFSLVAALAVAQYFKLARIPSNAVFLLPTAIAGGFDDRAVYEAQRALPLLGLVPRLNLLEGGSLGSSSAVAVVVSLLCLAGYVSGLGGLLRLVIGALCLVAGVLTTSFSVFVPVFVFLFVEVYRRAWRSVLAVVAVAVTAPAMVLLATVPAIEGRSLAAYATWVTSILFARASSISLVDLLFGIGPFLTAQGYGYRPGNYVADIGVLGVLQETGLANFAILAVVIGYVVYLALRRLANRSEAGLVPFVLPFGVLCCLVHQNFTIGPPFYVLFAVGLSGVLSFSESLGSGTLHQGVPRERPVDG